MADHFMLAPEGSIHLVTGPMFSGKTTELIRRLRTGVAAGLRPLLVRPTVDDRWETAEGVAARTHAGEVLLAQEAECAVEERLGAVAERAEVPPIVGVDEGQFFEDLAPACRALAGRGATVVVAALNGTFDQTPFEPVAALMPLCEEVTMCHAVCMRCRRRPAAFTALLRSERGAARAGGYTRVGGAETYQAVCRRCL